MKSKLVIDRLESGKIKNVNISEISEPVQVLRTLATCYRESNKTTRKNEKITKARAWEAYTPDGLKCQKFTIEIKYDSLNHYIYNYEFYGCGLD